MTTAVLLASVGASIALTLVYALGGNPQLEGLFLGIALGGLAVGLVLAARRLLPPGPFVQERHVLPGERGAFVEAERSFERAGGEVPRRRFLERLFGLAVGALGMAALFPIRSLGERPGGELFRTSWRAGLRLVTREGRPIRARDVAVNTVLTVFPEGFTDAADAQTLLIRLPDDVDAPGPEGAAVDGFVAFSKVCTHAGCPVGLYQARSHELFCPCHQSVFDVMQAARPTAGPATRPLPQLPLGLTGDGYLVAEGDFPEPVGPGFWNRGRA